MDPRFEQFKDLDWKSMSFPEKRDVWLQISDMSAEDFDAMMAVSYTHLTLPTILLV